MTSEACASVGKAGARMHTSGLTDICQRSKREGTCSASKIPFCTEWMPHSPGEFLRGIPYFQKKARNSMILLLRNRETSGGGLSVIFAHMTSSEADSLLF